MMEEDVIKNPHEYCFGKQIEEEYPDNFSMSIEALYKILDEDDADPRSLDFLGIPEVSHLEKMECQSHHDALHPQPEAYPTEMVANFLNESRCNKSLFGHQYQHNGTCDHFSNTCYEEPVNEEIHDMSRHVESNDSHGESFGSLVIDDANFHNLQNNDSNYYSLGSADEIGLTYPHYSITADTDLDAPEYNHASEGVETTLHNSFRRFIDNLDYISSPSVCHMGESLSHSKLLDHEGCCVMNIDATPYSTTQNGSIQRSVVTSGSENLALTHHFNVSPKINGAEEFSESRDANNSFLMDVTENLLINAEDASKPSLLVQMRDLPRDEVVLLCGDNREGAQLNLGNDSVKYEVEGQSPHSSVLDESVVDLSVFEPCGLCVQQCKCEDIGIMSESSTDSSPMLYHHKPVLHNLNCSSTKSELTVSDCKVGLQRKVHDSSLKNKKQPQISTNGQELRTFKGSKIICQSNPSRLNSTLDDVLIIEEISDPVPPIPPPARFNSQQLSHPCSFSDYHAGQGTLRSWPDDERLTFRLALQDLSQPKAEANPPDGVLAVPLLRHQRIALSWMVQKEIAGLNCSGGILADDQGLGKTISTIALILTERSPSSSCSLISEDCEFEPLNLDDEEDDGKVYFEGDKKNHHSDSLLSMPVRSEKVDCSLLPARSEKVDCSLLPLRPEKVLVPVKGRPAAGTLVVCPTSVLRQWADELQSKITNKAKFSFLIYHGSNRTKDPYELAKFDVVVTTYAIVSMEVPKQSLVDKDDMERGKHDGCSILAGNLTCKRRKESSSVSSKNPKRKIASDSSVFNFTPRPLAKVGWFRVILDEAQSIKNHRTQVARACWGLRAKRRWCLSGTPIQNAVDDLYSYFRFLRYDPYAVYKSFCSTIKLPISRNPTNGYKKLQAVLKTVMLRRTKGTLIDGKPIISLPPKTVNLKRVDFSDEEFMFYLALEAECRKQFKVYAAAGTVKQNYVNILLMLLRLRQACDHPLLVKCHDSSSVWKSSLEKAKKLPKDKLMDLLSCLEACLAICTICNDPPEDAVVSICGHVFCNQCICEHITGDDNICPSANCKNELSVGCIFSVDTLRRCLTEQPGVVFCSDNSISDVDHGAKISQQSLFSSSSKIRAALEILNSLPLSKISFSPYEALKPFNGSSVWLKNTISAVSSECSSDTAMDQKPILDSNVKHREKAIIFSQWTRMLDLLETSLKDSGILYRRLDGTMSVISREKAIKDFNRLPEITVIIMSLKAASLGLNMVAACHVVLLDLWWNPTTEDQAIDRAHRIGQTRPVTVFRLTVKETVEDRILALQEKKRTMVASAFGEDESGTRQSRLTVEDLKYLFLG